MRYLLVILLIMSAGVQAQPPRNTLDQYEYTQEISVSMDDSLLVKRAKSFFLQPFIVHWDSVAFVGPVHTAKGHINVRVNYRLSSFVIPIALKMELDLKASSYRYSIRHFEADKKNSKYIFPLEHKPETVNTVIYEQLIQKTHRYIGSVISMLKRYMQGDL